MTPKELHDACHEAKLECPGAIAYDDDTYFSGFGMFAEIPEKGLMNVVKFWRDDNTLWESGYSEALPQEALTIFKDLDKVINKAINDYFGSKACLNQY